MFLPGIIVGDAAGGSYSLSTRSTSTVSQAVYFRNPGLVES